MAKQNEFIFEIDHKHERAGWIDCYLGFGGRRYELAASDIDSPFPHLLELVTAIATQRLPFHFYWDEEGKGVEFDAMPLSDDDPRFHLHIQHDRQDKAWVDAVLERAVVVDVILAALRDFALNAGPPTRIPWHLSLANVEKVEQMLANLPAVRSDITQAVPVKFKFTLTAKLLRWARCWRLRCCKCRFLPCLLDSDPFWTDLFSFMEKVLKNDLPARVDYIDRNMIDLLKEAAEEDGLSAGGVPCEPGLVAWAEAVSHVGHFRWKIFEDDCRKTNFLRVNEVLDRCQFARSFCMAFEDLLDQIDASGPDSAASAFS